jgi:hypothetical protein
MAALITTVCVLSAGTLAALLCATDLGAQLALAVVAII